MTTTQCSDIAPVRRDVAPAGDPVTLFLANDLFPMMLGLWPASAAQFDGGVLRAQLNKAEVTELVYQTFVFHNICAREWYEPQQFASLGLARVELLNAKGDQGFAFDTRGNVCTEMGRLGKNFRTFISQYTVACTASGCPPQR